MKCNFCFLQLQKKEDVFCCLSLDAGPSLNVCKASRKSPGHETFRRRPRLLLSIWSTFNLHTVSRGQRWIIWKTGPPVTSDFTSLLIFNINPKSLTVNHMKMQKLLSFYSFLLNGNVGGVKVKQFHQQTTWQSNSLFISIKWIV